MKKIKEKIANRVNKTIAWLKSVKVKGATLSIYDVLAIFVEKLKKNNHFEKAAAISYSFTIATFPAIIFLFTLIPHLPIEGAKVQIMDLLEDILPETIFHTAESNFVEFISTKHSGLLTFGFLLALMSATNGMFALMSAFDNCYHKVVKRSWFKKRMIALMLTLVMSFLLVSYVFVLILGKKFLIYLMQEDLISSSVTFPILNILRYVLILLIFFFGISLTYKLAPAVPQRWKLMSAGAWASTVISILFCLVFAYYIDHFTKYNELYGALGALIGYMIWLFFMSLVLLIGFEINATIDHITESKRKVEEEKANAKWATEDGTD